MANISPHIHKECPCCKKTFVIDFNFRWAYREEQLYFCSWSCLCRYRRDAAGKSRREIKNYGKKDSARNFCCILYEMCQYFGLTYSDLAAYLGVSNGSVSRYNNHDSLPLRHVNRLCEGFGCTPDDLFALSFDEKRAESWRCVIPHETRKKK